MPLDFAVGETPAQADAAFRDLENRRRAEQLAIAQFYEEQNRARAAMASEQAARRRQEALEQQKMAQQMALQQQSQILQANNPLDWFKARADVADAASRSKYYTDRLGLDKSQLAADIRDKELDRQARLQEALGRRSLTEADVKMKSWAELIDAGRVPKVSQIDFSGLDQAQRDHLVQRLALNQQWMAEQQDVMLSSAVEKANETMEGIKRLPLSEGKSQEELLRDTYNSLDKKVQSLVLADRQTGRFVPVKLPPVSQDAVEHMRSREPFRGPDVGPYSPEEIKKLRASAMKYVGTKAGVAELFKRLTGEDLFMPTAP